VQRRCPSCEAVFPADVFFCGYCGTVAVEVQDPNDPDPRLGGILGQYVLVARVADGAMGRVYEGRHPATKARVAIKVLHADVAQDDVSVERFRREFETAQGFDHPHIVQVLEFGDTGDGSHFLTMEYLQGEELGDVLRRDGTLPQARMLRVLCQTALGLEHAHSFGVIHRDLKPDNVFLVRTESGDDEVRLLDFGSVKLQVEVGPKLTAFGTTLGSPYYMSPEQASGRQDVDPRSDVFALTSITYEMATGQVAFGGGQVGEILMKIMSHTPPPPSTLKPGLPQAFDDVVEVGLRKNKAQRYASATELAQAVLASFGLSGSVEQWARTSTAQLEQALAQAQPPAPKPFTPSPGRVPQPAPTAIVAEEDAEGDLVARPKPSLVAVVVGLAVAGLLMVGGMLVAAFLIFG
jgi:serine/threonine protein kinase